MNIQIAIFRPDANLVDYKYYNSQEIGLAKSLAKHNIDIDIFTAGRSKSIVKNEVHTEGSGCVLVYEMPYYTIPEIDHAIYPKLIKTLKQNNYSLIQVSEYNELSCFWVARYAKHNDIPCLVYQGMYRPLSGRIRAAFQSIYNKYFLPKFITYVQLAAGKTTHAEEYLKKKGFTNTTVIPVGLDIQAFYNHKNRDWYKEYSIPKDNKILLYIGIFEDRRNINFLLDIGQRLKNKGYTLLLAGDGPIYTKVKQRIAQENINNVHVIGKILQEYLKSLYETADYFLLASNYEIYGMVVLEALYFGCPVLSTKTAGPTDMIIDGVNGYLLENLDVNNWVDLIINNDIKFDRQAIRSKLLKELTWDVIAKRYIKIFNLYY